MANPLTSYTLVFGLLLSTMALGSPEPTLTFDQSQAFSSWFLRIVNEQLARGPSPRWTQKDCAGLVRFATYEALKPHDEKWLRANGVVNRNLPPEVDVTPAQMPLLNRWKQVGGKGFDAFTSAIGIVQENSRFVSKSINQARPGDLLFFDQGEDQHLMIWMGSFVAYHTGTQSRQDSGLRRVGIDSLMNWKDTRWQPRPENPNFVGVYRLSFLSR